MIVRVRNAAVLATALLVLPSPVLAADPPSEAESSLLAAEQAFAAAAKARDLAGFSSHLADNAVFAGGTRILRGKEAVVQGWSPFFAPEGPSIGWSPDLAVVLDDGSLGITKGPYLVEYPDQDGSALHSEGTFFSVWRRHGEEWKIVLDTGVQCVPRMGEAPESDTDSEPEADPGAAADQGASAGLLEDLRWMVGSWRGPGLGGDCEEVWSAPAGGAMMGMFRLVKDGEVSFYEIITLTEKDGKPHMRLKHFGPGLEGWEDRSESVEFPFVSQNPDTLVLEGIAYHRNGDNGLDIEVELSSSETASRRELLRLERLR